MYIETKHFKRASGEVSILFAINEIKKRKEIE